MASVDIIVPCYKYGHFLHDCVGSALSQGVDNIRVLIIDDASPDNSGEVAEGLAKSDSRVEVVRHAANKGHISTFNEGIEWTRADYSLLISADDYLLPGALSRAIKIFESHSDVGFVFGKAIEFDDSAGGQKPSVVNPGLSAPYRVMTGEKFIDLNGIDNIVRTPTAVVRTALQKHLGGYRHQLPHSGDMEMWLRFAAQSSVGMSDAFQAVYRRHSQNMSHMYVGQHWLPDLQQRKLALDEFFRSSGQYLRDVGKVRRHSMKGLAYGAVGCASGAFNDGEIELATELSAFALEVYPETRRSWPWMKMTLKRRMGSGGWSALRPALTRVRHAFGRGSDS